MGGVGTIGLHRFGGTLCRGWTTHRRNNAKDLNKRHMRGVPKNRIVYFKTTPNQDSHVGDAARSVPGPLWELHAD